LEGFPPTNAAALTATEDGVRRSYWWEEFDLFPAAGVPAALFFFAPI
jgi:hypothetical protein